MEEVDYSKLSEQYASFLVAVGGVSITVLTLVLSLGSSATKLTEQDLGSFLILDLVVATVCCFIGAHMMAETAAFINHAKEKLKAENPTPDTISPVRVPLGERLFLLASANIFISIILVLFALMLLPSASNLSNATSIKWISFFIFMFVVVGALIWMVLAANHRMPVEPVTERRRAIRQSIGIGLLWACVLCGSLLIHKVLLLWLTFLVIALIAVGSLLRFALIFKESNKTSNQEVSINDIRLFSSAITISYASLIINAIRTMFL